MSGTDPVTLPEATDHSVGPRDWRATLRRFWKLSPHGGIDIVCAEIPEHERARFASLRHRNYMRYARFADLDTLIYVRGRITQTVPDIHIRDFVPSEYHGSDATTLVVIGGSLWNSTYRDFLPQLPYHFAPNTPGEDEPLGVLGAARCFLQCERGAANVDYVSNLAGNADFVLVTEARRVGGITHVADLAKVNPLLLLARHDNEPFTLIQNNTPAWLDQP